MKTLRRITHNVKRTLRNIMKYITYKLYTSRDDYKRAAKADDLCSFIWDYQQYLRGQWKYAEKPDDIDKIYDKWFEMLNENNINMDELYT